MIVAVVPIKRLSEAKSRLAARLSARDRTALALTLLERTVAALRSSGVVQAVALATPEEELSTRFGLTWLADSGSLNETLEAGVQWALGENASSLLVAPGDLPRINAAAVRGVALRDRRLPSIDIAPTQDGGTGFLLLTPPDAIAPCFGPNSFRRHTLLAELRTVAVHEVTDEAFTFDLDTPEDLNLALPYLRGVLST